MAVVLLTADAGCGDSGARTLPPASPAERARDWYRSAGTELLSLVPEGADVAVEIDLQRIRNNPVVGELFAESIGLAPSTGLGFDPMRHADAVALVGYGLGGPEPTTITVVKSDRLAELAGSQRLADGVVAVAPPEMRKRALAVKRREIAPLTYDVEFMRLRDRAVPRGAPGASLRLTARLDFDARVSLAGLLELSQVPTVVSLWGDVVDDLAIVALLGAEGPKQAVALAKASKAQLHKMKGHPVIRRLILGYLLDEVDVKAGKGGAQLTLIINPRRLTLLTRRLTRYARRARGPTESRDGQGTAVPEQQLQSPSEPERLVPET